LIISIKDFDNQKLSIPTSNDNNARVHVH